MRTSGLVRFVLTSLLSVGLLVGGQQLAAEPVAASGPEHLQVGDPARRERSVTPILDAIVDTRRSEVIDTVELTRR